MWISLFRGIDTRDSYVLWKEINPSKFWKNAVNSLPVLTFCGNKLKMTVSFFKIR